MTKETIKLINDTVSTVALTIVGEKSNAEMIENLRAIGAPKEVIDHCITTASTGRDIIDEFYL